MTTSGSGGPPRPIATTTTRLSRASRRARWPVTAVLPTRFPVPTTAIDGSGNASSTGGSSRKSAPTYGTPWCEHAAGEREPRDRAEHRLVREIDDDVRAQACDSRLHVGHERNAVLVPAAELLLTADEHGRDEVVRQLGERVTDDRGVVLAVDDGESPHVRVVTSSSIAPVNFAYSSVSSANETSLTWPWKGWRRQMSTRFSSISITL